MRAAGELKDCGTVRETVVFLFFRTDVRNVDTTERSFVPCDHSTAPGCQEAADELLMDLRLYRQPEKKRVYFFPCNICQRTFVCLFYYCLFTSFLFIEHTLVCT